MKKRRTKDNRIVETLTTSLDGDGKTRSETIVYDGLYEQAPKFMQDNRYLRFGYRLNCTSALDCFRSLWFVHNETFNIWTHLIAAVAFTLMSANTLLMDRCVASAPLHAWQILAFGYGASICCFVCSTLYHLFNCASPGASRRFLILDLFGVLCIILAFWTVGLYLGFYHFDWWRRFYMWTMLVLAVGAVLSVIVHKLRTNRSIRVAAFAALATYGFVPMIHWVQLQGGLFSPVSVAFLPKFLCMYLCAGIGLTFYLTRWPERSISNRFVSLCGHSHILWHIFVVGAAYSMYDLSKRYYCFLFQNEL
jgi:adiponectin receptor